jgi:methylated-DNA-[protein]-cysteine S-methyltransferase
MPVTPVLIGSTTSTRLAEVWVAVSERGLIAVEFSVCREEFEASVGKHVRGGIRPAHGRAPQMLSQASAEIGEYLAGRRRTFGVPIDWSILTSDFQRLALRAVSAIPYGETRTYGEIAEKIGYPQAPRAVGRANATNPMPLVIPCHRVIGSDGKLHGYGGAGGLKTKQWLLDLEGADSLRQKATAELRLPRTW